MSATTVGLLDGAASTAAASLTRNSVATSAPASSDSHALRQPPLPQPRDLLLQIKNLCDFQGHTPEMTAENFDFAVENYFAVM